MKSSKVIAGENAETISRKCGTENTKGSMGFRFAFFPNRSLLLRVLMAVKEGSPRKHTQSVQRPLWSAGPGSQRLF